MRSQTLNASRYTNGTLAKIMAETTNFVSYDYKPETNTGTFNPATTRLTPSFSGGITLGGWEYLDGETWKPMPGLTVKTETISGKTKDTGEAFNETITYNKSYAVKETWQPTFDFTLTQETPEAKIRLRVCSEWQVNDVCFLHPRTQSVQRIAGRTMPVIWEIVE